LRTQGGRVGMDFDPDPVFRSIWIGSYWLVYLRYATKSIFHTTESYRNKHWEVLRVGKVHHSDQWTFFSILCIIGWMERALNQPWGILVKKLLQFHLCVHQTMGFWPCSLCEPQFLGSGNNIFTWKLHTSRIQGDKLWDFEDTDVSYRPSLRFWLLSFTLYQFQKLFSS
jgi:hypothetical protein